MRISEEQVRRLDAYWRAANYLTVGQIYLQDNPLLREPLRPEHIKPRLLGHWGTSPGLSFIYAHLNRLVKETDTSAIYLAGPGHGGPAIVANVYLEGTYSEIYPEVSRDLDGMRRLFRQFSTPGGVPSHVSASLSERPLLSAEELRERMSGNICRCGAYSNIVEAISEVAGVRT